MIMFMLSNAWPLVGAGLFGHNCNVGTVQGSIVTGFVRRTSRSLDTTACVWVFRRSLVVGFHVVLSVLHANELLVRRCRPRHKKDIATRYLYARLSLCFA